MVSAKLSIIGVCLMVVSLIMAVITGHGLFIITTWLGLIFVVIDLFTD